MQTRSACRPTFCVRSLSRFLRLYSNTTERCRPSVAITRPGAAHTTSVRRPAVSRVRRRDVHMWCDARAPTLVLRTPPHSAHRAVSSTLHISTYNRRQHARPRPTRTARRRAGAVRVTLPAPHTCVRACDPIIHHRHVSHPPRPSDTIRRRRPRAPSTRSTPALAENLPTPPPRRRRREGPHRAGSRRRSRGPLPRDLERQVGERRHARQRNAQREHLPRRVARRGDGHRWLCRRPPPRPAALAAARSS